MNRLRMLDLFSGTGAASRAAEYIASDGTVDARISATEIVITVRSSSYRG